LFPPELADELPNILDKVRRGQRIEVLETSRVRKDGQRIHVSLTVSPLLDATGRIVGASTIDRDISERKRSEQALRKLWGAVEQITEAVCVTDEKGLIEYVNPAFERLTGYTAEEVRGKTPRILKSGKQDGAFYEELWKTILAGQVFRCVLVNKKKDGALFHAELVITPIRHETGQIAHFVCTWHDITRRIRTEEALRRLNEKLEEEPKRIAQALHDEAGQFLSSAHLALAEIARDLPMPVRERLQMVREHLHKVEEQLRHLAHELRPRILDDLGLVPALKFLADGAGRRSGIPITVDALVSRRLQPMVETTLYRLTQETLTNVTRHARATRVTIHLERGPGAVRFAIRDDGVGFDVTTVQARLGALQITSAPDKGTEVVAVIPVEE